MWSVESLAVERLALSRCQGLCGYRQPIHRPLGTRGLDKGHPLRCVEAEAVGQFLGQRARGAPCIGLDLLDQIKRAADPLREFCLGQVERLAPPSQAVAERVRAVHPTLLP